MAEIPTIRFEHDWHPDLGVCRRCAIGFAHAWHDPRLAECQPNVVGMAVRTVRLTDAVVTANWRQFNAWSPDDGGAA